MYCTKRFLRFLLLAPLCVLLAAILGTGLLTAAYLLPADAMAEHMESSARTILQEGVYPQMFPWCTSQLDNYTDSFILMHASNDSELSPLVQAMTVARPGIEGIDEPTDVLAAHYQRGTPYDTQIPYYQYWHGYLIFVKPLLLLTDYSGIRIVNAVVQTLMLALLLVLMVRRGLKRYIVAYLISLAFLMPVTLAMSLQFSSCYYIMTIGAIAVVWMRDVLDRYDAFIFLLIGIATAYFDYLTYPIATFCIPAAFYFCVQERMPPRVSLARGTGIIVSWGFGYGAMWACKWILGSVLTGYNVLSVASQKLAERSSLDAIQSADMFYGLRVALFENITAFLHTPVTLVFAAALLVLFIQVIRGLRKIGFRDLAALVLPYLILACLPLGWYLLTANHSSIHGWFTNKALVSSAFAALCALISARERIRASTCTSAQSG